MLRIFFLILIATIGISHGQVGVGPNLESTSKINTGLLRALETGESPDVIISFHECTEEPLRQASLLTTDDRGERAKAIYQSLVEHSNKSQSGLEQMLSTRSGTSGDIAFKRFWISNQMWVSGADLKTIREMAEDPNVSGIVEDAITQLLDVDYSRDEKKDGPAPRPEEGTIQWNIERVQAPQAWEELGGKGEGIIVAIIDSGVNGAHEALKDNFVGDYGWFDAYRGRVEPFDDGGHGTNVAGAAVGNRGIGVAPGAKWAGCKGCDGVNYCKISTLIECMQFFACPTLADGSNMDCSKVPHIVVNSWGGGDAHLISGCIIDAWVQIGIVPVFAIGNKNSCGSTVYPGEHPSVIGVGSISIGNTTDYVSSSKGPARDGKIKPNVVAYGEEVVLANGYRDEGYYIQSGTSFACPQAAGVVALILSLDEKMIYEKVKDLLFNNTEKSILQIPTEKNDLGRPRTCGSVKDGELIFPNNVYGYGLVNALGSVMAYKEMVE